jgi:hypothetical protein
LTKPVTNFILVAKILVNKFMDTIAKGGRGKRAPYISTHHRIPEPIKPVVEQLADAYRSVLDEGSDPDELLERVKAAIATTPEKPVNGNIPDYEEIRDRILSSVRSDKLKAVRVALDGFIAELRDGGK